MNPVLIWVQQADEAVIKDAFQKTLAVRTLSAQARELADTYFFETLVRQTEEEVLYPAAILIGEYSKSTLNQ